MTRGAFRIVLPGRLLQRGQIYTWPRDRKLTALRAESITAIVNLWPKADPDLGEAGLDWVWQISCPRSEMMKEPYVELAAHSAAEYLRLPGKQLLVLCEAGRTRSVYFCIMVSAFFNHWTATQSRSAVLSAIPGTSLKQFMMEWVA